MKLDSDTCYTQIYGPHSSLNDAKNACDNMGDECNGIQKVECTGVEPKITKSTMKTLCRSKSRYHEDPNWYMKKIEVKKVYYYFNGAAVVDIKNSLLTFLVFSS